MKLIPTVLAATMTLIWLTPDDAEAASRNRSARVRTVKTQVVRVSHQRSASTGANGLCQRDTGTPDSQLNFRNKCDTEEYWNRVMDRGTGIGR